MNAACGEEAQPAHASILGLLFHGLIKLQKECLISWKPRVEEHCDEDVSNPWIFPLKRDKHSSWPGIFSSFLLFYERDWYELPQR